MLFQAVGASQDTGHLADAIGSHASTYCMYVLPVCREDEQYLPRIGCSSGINKAWRVGGRSSSSLERHGNR